MYGKTDEKERVTEWDKDGKETETTEERKIREQHRDKETNGQNEIHLKTVLEINTRERQKKILRKKNKRVTEGEHHKETE